MSSRSGGGKRSGRRSGGLAEGGAQRRAVIELVAPAITLLEDEEPASAPAAPWVRRLTKRAIDIVGALVLISLTLPLLVVVAVAVALHSPGPVFFAHRRLGRGGRHFDCLKFRTMVPRAEQMLAHDHALRHQYVSNHFKIPAELDPRITAFGRLLRRSSIDELPQLWNVLKGDMSLVGPRPIVAVEGSHYGERLAELLSVRPGLTGAWAVSGRSRLGYPERVAIELEYVRGWSIAGDLAILARTPAVVLTQGGAV